jgi:hypothetical protein
MQVSRCWLIDAGIPGVEEMEAQVEVVVNPDATVASAEYSESTTVKMADAAFSKFAESARRAVLKCSPLDVPRSLPYEEWKHITFTFNPKEMLGP